MMMTMMTTMMMMKMMILIISPITVLNDDGDSGGIKIKSLLKSYSFVLLTSVVLHFHFISYEGQSFQKKKNSVYLS